MQLCSENSCSSRRSSFHAEPCYPSKSVEGRHAHGRLGHFLCFKRNFRKTWRLGKRYYMPFQIHSPWKIKNAVSASRWPARQAWALVRIFIFMSSAFMWVSKQHYCNVVGPLRLHSRVPAFQSNSSVYMRYVYVRAILSCPYVWSGGHCKMLWVGIS